MSDNENGDWADAQENAEENTYEVHGSREVYRGNVISLRVDQVAMPGGSVAERDVIVHPGAVGVVALREDGTVLLLRQYRHPVGETLWELPAGILDVDDEPALQAAQRELGEEAFLTARAWSVLVDMYSSPGMSNEAVRIYLARDIEEIPEQQRYEGVDEEADMERHWIALDDAVERILQGEITNNLACVGLLAAAAARRKDFEHVRRADAPWPAKPTLADHQTPE
jgi:ADP-ribose pyrophosphatase